MSNRERFTELMYEYEKNSFLLSILEARLAVVLHAESMGYSDTVTALIAKISPQYVKMLRAIKDKNGGSIEEMAQIAFDKIYVYDGYSKRDFSKFREFDTSLLEEWFALKQRERELRAGLIKQDEAIADFKHAFYMTFGADIDVRVKQEQKTDQKPKEVKEKDEDDETVEEFNIRMAKEQLVCQMFKDSVIDEKTALRYMDAQNLPSATFLKLVEMHTNTPDGGEE